MDNKIYKIKHLPTGKFVKIKLEIQGVDGWEKRGGIQEGTNGGAGKLLVDFHEGWKTPPTPTNKEFARINCKVVCYDVILVEDKNYE